MGVQSGTPFGSAFNEEPIVFDMGDWCGYDEAADEAVGIYELKWEIVRSKNLK